MIIKKILLIIVYTSLQWIIFSFMYSILLKKPVLAMQENLNANLILISMITFFMFLISIALMNSTIRYFS